MAVKTDKFIGTKIESLDGTFSINIKDLGTGDLSNAVVSGSFNTSTQTLTLTKGDNSTIDIDLSSLAGGGGSGEDKFIDDIYVFDNELTISRSDGTELVVDINEIDTKDAETIKGKQIDTLPTEPLILMYNPNTDKFEFTSLPTCEQGNIIVPTYTRVETGLTAQDVEQMIANRIAAMNIQVGIEPVRYICLEPNTNVPINKGVINQIGNLGQQIYSNYMVTNGDFIFCRDSSDTNKILKIDFNGNIVKEYTSADDSFSWLLGITRNGKRLFDRYGIYALNDDGTITKESDAPTSIYYTTSLGQYLVNSCGNRFAYPRNKKVYRLDEGGTWVEEAQFQNFPLNSIDAMSFTGYGFRYAAAAYQRRVVIGEFDEQFNWNTLKDLDLSEYLSKDIKGILITNDLKVLYVNENMDYLKVFIKNENGEYKHSATIKPDNKRLSTYYGIAINASNTKLAVKQGDSPFDTILYEVKMTPSMYCGSQKQYTVDNTFDVSSYLNGEKLTAATRYFSQPLGNFFIGTDAGKVLKVDLINDTSEQIADVGERILSLACNTNGTFLAMNYGSSSGSNKVRKYDIVNNSLYEEITYSAANYRYALNHTLAVRENGDTYLTVYTEDDEGNSGYTQCMSGNSDCYTMDANELSDGYIGFSQNNRYEISIRYDSNSDKSFIDVIDITDTSSTASGGLVLNGEYNIVNITNDNIMLLQTPGITEAEAYCIEDLGNIVKIEDNIPLYNVEGILQKQFIAEYSKSQKTITRVKSNTEIEVFSLLV